MSIVLDLDLCRRLMLDVDVEIVREAILAAPKLRLKGVHVRVTDERTVKVLPTVENRHELLHNVQVRFVLSTCIADACMLGATFFRVDLGFSSFVDYSKRAFAVLRLDCCCH